MSQVSTSDIRARIKALCALVPGITTIVSNEIGLDDSALPAIRVRIGTRISNRPVGAHQRLVTYQWEIWLAIQRVQRVDVDSEVDAAFDAMDVWLDIIPDFFKAHPRLALNDSGLVHDTGEMSIGMGIDRFLSADYALIRYILPVTNARF